MPNEPSGQVAAPTQGTARVRFEFAGRAHRREFTPKLEIKRKENKVKEKEGRTPEEWYEAKAGFCRTTS